MGRISVYVEDALHERMKTLGNGIKWSQVAQEAFARVVAKVDPAETSKPKETAPLRFQRDAYGEKHRLEGKTRGRNWATNHATADQLERLAQIAIGAITHAEHAQLLLYKAVFNNEPIQWRYGGRFFETYLGERHPLKERVEGFIEGAGRVFNARSR